MNSVDTQLAKPTVVITGCSSGIGFHCAIDLASRGWRVYAGVRRDEDGQNLARSAGQNVTPLLLDITCSHSLAKAFEFLNAELGETGLDALVNNAGLLISGPLELISLEQLRRQFDVNVFGTHAMTLAALPLMKKRALNSGTARLVFIGSISGRMTPPFYGAYSASKHALAAMADAWRMELSTARVQVSIVEPDSVSTPIWDKSNAELSELSAGVSKAPEAISLMRSLRRYGLTNKQAGMDPARVVTAVRSAITTSRPKSHYPVGWRTRPAFVLDQLLPTRWMDRILRKAMGG